MDSDLLAESTDHGFCCPEWRDEEKQQISDLLQKLRPDIPVQFEEDDTGLHLGGGKVIIQKDYTDNHNKSVDIPSEGKYANKAFRFLGEKSIRYTGKIYERYSLVAGSNVLSIRYKTPAEIACAAITAYEAYESALEEDELNGLEDQVQQ